MNFLWFALWLKLLDHFDYKSRKNKISLHFQKIFLIFRMCPWKFGKWYFQVKRALLRFLRISSASKALNDSDEDAKNPPIQHIFRWIITKNELPQNLLQIMLISPSFTSDRNWKFIFSIFDFFKHEINFESLKCSKFKDIKFISKILFFLSVQFYLCKYQDFFKFSPFKNKKKLGLPKWDFYLWKQKFLHCRDNMLWK